VFSLFFPVAVSVWVLFFFFFTFWIILHLFIYLFSFIHMCMQCFGHFSPLLSSFIHFELMLAESGRLKYSFYMWSSSLPSTIYWRRCLFFNVFIGLLCQNSNDQCCMDFCLGHLLCSVGFHVCFNTSKIMF
jgi:hypothetical protein